jgi:hypothetical protein
MRSQPAAFNAAIFASSDWASVETLTYPSNIGPTLLRIDLCKIQRPPSAAAGNPGAPIEVLIGEVVAAAVVALCRALAEFQDGGLTPPAERRAVT